MQKELILQIKIPNYPRKVMTSKARRAKYFKPTDKLPMKYLQKDKCIEGFLYAHSSEVVGIGGLGLNYLLNKDFIWKDHKLTNKKTERRLYNIVTKEYVIRNPKIAGTENWKTISGQDIYRYGMQNWNVSNIIGKLHDYLLKELDKLNITPIPVTKFPISIHYHFECDMGDNMDVDNYGLPYYKSLQDCLVKSGIIPGDTRKYVEGFKVTSSPIEVVEGIPSIDILTVKIYANTGT